MTYLDALKPQANQQPNQLPSQSQPTLLGTAGQMLNDVPGHLQTLGNLAVSILRSFPREGAAIGNVLTGKQQFTPTTGLEKLALGTEPIGRPQAEGQKTLQGFGVPQGIASKLGLPAFIGQVILDTTNLGGEARFIKEIAASKDVAEIGNLLVKAKVPLETAKELAPKLVEVTKSVEVKTIIENTLKDVKQTSPQLLKSQEGKLSPGESSLGQTPPRPPSKPPLNVSLSSNLPPYSPEVNSSIEKVTKALQEAAPVRKGQEALYTVTRGERAAAAQKAGAIAGGGEAGFRAELGAFKGEMPKVQFETIKGQIGEKDIQNLFDLVANHPTLNYFDSLTARHGLSKMLEGAVPTVGEIKLLERVFPPETITALLDKRGLLTKLKEAGYQLANIPRSLMASIDLSAPLRQGAFLIGHPRSFFGAFPDMFKAFASEDAFKAVQQSIMRKPLYETMKESGLALTDMGTALTTREERFMSNWAEKIPIIGRGVRASGRAYTAFLNKLRADVFEELVTKADAIGRNPKTSEELLSEIANFVNIASGRGGLGKLQGSAELLNSIFFSPRLAASRLTLLNPIYYVRADPFVRKEALKSLFAFTGAGLTMLGLAKMAGADVGIDPRSSDFGKIKIGNTRLDVWGGFQQYIRIAAQLTTGQYVSSTTGKVITVGQGYKPLTRLDILGRQIVSKEAPIASFVTDMLRGKDYLGNDINIPLEVGQRFVPLVIQDMYDLAKTDPKLLPLGILGVFGAGLQTYTNTKQSGGYLNKLK